MKKIYRKIIIGLLIITTGLIYLILILQIVNNEKIAFGIKIADANLGGQNITKSKNILKEQWNNFNEQNITLLYQEYNWPVKLPDLGFELKTQETIDKAYKITHQANIIINIKEQLFALFGLYQTEPIYEINSKKFEEKTIELFKNIEKPAQNASLIFNEELNSFSIQHSTKGTTIDREKLLNKLSENVSSFSLQSINLELIIDNPSVINNETNLANEKAQKILSKQPYQLILEDRTWTINKETLIDWIEFKPENEINSDNQILGVFLNEDKIKEYLLKISYEINKPATDAQLKTSSSTAILFIPDKPGFEIKTEKTIEQINNDILALEPNKIINIIADKSLPKITLGETNDLGINVLIGQGVSNFYGSSKNRIHNIKTGAATLNGIIIKPNEEFSFNYFINETGPEQGYLQELVIKKDKTILEYGGGLCQVSTTIFRAAIKAGLEITQRRPHAFPVGYYNPQGFDATVYSPWTDLRFINNTPNHILVQSFVSGYQLFFNFYGTNDGRKIIVKGPYVLEKKEDGSMKTVFTQEIYQKGELISKQEFYSDYKSPDLFPIEKEEE
ncbi:VanW family protein [Patescibacteria group bacterium]|nr:VanW family protein [Patescibacteria group bacterium]